MTCFDFRATCDDDYEILRPELPPVVEPQRREMFREFSYPVFFRDHVPDQRLPPDLRLVPDHLIIPPDHRPVPNHRSMPDLRLIPPDHRPVPDHRFEDQPCKCDNRHYDDFDFRAKDAKQMYTKWREEDIRRTKKGKYIYKLLQEEEKRLEYKRRLREIMMSGSKHPDPNEVRVPNSFYMFEKYVSYGFLQNLNELYSDRASNWRDDSWRENFVQICKSIKMAKLKRLKKSKSKRLGQEDEDALPCCNECQCDEIFIDTRFQCECHTRHLNPSLDAAKDGHKSKQTAREVYRNGRQKRHPGGESGRRSGKTSPRRRGIPGFNDDDYRYAEGSVQTPYYERAAMFFRDDDPSELKKEGHVTFASDVGYPSKTVKTAIDYIERKVNNERGCSNNMIHFSNVSRMGGCLSVIQKSTNVDQKQKEVHFKEKTATNTEGEEKGSVSAEIHENKIGNGNSNESNSNHNTSNDNNNNKNTDNNNNNNKNDGANSNDIVPDKFIYTQHWVETCPDPEDESNTTDGITLAADGITGKTAEETDKTRLTEDNQEHSEEISEEDKLNHHIEELMDGSNSTMLQEIRKNAAETENTENVKVDDEFLFSKVTSPSESAADVVKEKSQELVKDHNKEESTDSNIANSEEKSKQPSCDGTIATETETNTDENEAPILDRISLENGSLILEGAENVEVENDTENLNAKNNDVTNIEIKEGGEEQQNESEDFEVEAEVEMSLDLSEGEEEEREEEKERKINADEQEGGEPKVNAETQECATEQMEQEGTEKSGETNFGAVKTKECENIISEDEEEDEMYQGEKKEESSNNEQDDEDEREIEEIIEEHFHQDHIESNDEFGSPVQMSNEMGFINDDPMLNFQDVDKYPIFGSDDEEEFLRHSVNNPRAFGESPLFSPMMRRVKRTETTDLNNLNFSKISAKVCRQRHSPISIDCSEGPQSMYRKRMDTYMLTPKSLKHMTSQSMSNLFYRPDDYVGGKHVVIPKIPQGCVGRADGRIYDYHIDVPPQEGHHGKDLTEIIFRNPIPIQDIIPSDSYEPPHPKNKKSKKRDKTKGKKDAKRNNSGDPHSEEKKSIEKPANVTNSEPRSPRYRRQFPDVSFPKTMRHVTERLRPDVLPILAHNISRVWREEGRKLKMSFLRHMLQINEVVNGVLAHIPHHAFPFTLKPVTIEEGFERKGQFAVDLFLVLEDFKRTNCSVDFTTGESISARVNISAFETKFGKFCTKRNSSGERILSPKLLRDVFADSIDTYARPRYENSYVYENGCRGGSKASTRSTVHFECINKDIILHIFFPRKRIVFQVRLILAVDVEHVPPDLCQAHESKLLNAFVSTGMSSGVYLLARPQNFTDHLWEVNFIKARRNLIEMFDRDGTLSVVVLALQFLNEHFLSRDCSEMLLPFHFHNLLIWIQATTPKKERECMRKYLAFHFLRILNGLKQCLVDGQCTDFFWPDVNYFATLSKSALGMHLSNLNGLLNAFGVDL